MKMKQKLKMLTDILMTVLLLILMCYQVTGDKWHEIFGAIMLVLFIVHNALNIKWYGALFKGAYRPLRILRTAVNLGVLVCILCLAYSGIVLSRHVFAALPISGPLATARRMHLCCSYLGFVLMSFHLGMHWGMVLGMFKRLRGGKPLPRAALYALRIVAASVSAYGLYLFISKNILSYIFLRTEFVFFDYSQSAVTVFMQHIAMMALFVCAGYCSFKALS